MHRNSEQQSQDQGIDNISNYLENPNVSDKDKVIVLTSSYARDVGQYADPADRGVDDTPVMTRWLNEFIQSTDNTSMEEYFSDKRVPDGDKQRLFHMSDVEKYADGGRYAHNSKEENAELKGKWAKLVGGMAEIVPWAKNIPASYFEMDVYKTSDAFVQAKAETLHYGLVKKERRVSYRDSVRVKEVVTTALGGFVLEKRSVIDSMDGTSHAVKNTQSGHLISEDGKPVITEEKSRVFPQPKNV